MDIISKKVLSQLVITSMIHCSEVLGQTMPRECTTSVSPLTPTSVSTLLSTVVKAHRAPALCTHITLRQVEVLPAKEGIPSNKETAVFGWSLAVWGSGYSCLQNSDHRQRMFLAKSGFSFRFPSSFTVRRSPHPPLGRSVICAFTSEPQRGFSRVL